MKPARRHVQMGTALALALLMTACAHSGSKTVNRSLLLNELNLDPAGAASFSPLASRERVLLITFTASWCFPCTSDLPTFKALDQKYAAQGLQVVAVGLDLEGRRVLAPFASFHELHFPLLIADDRIRQGEGIFGRVTNLPTTFLIDRDGDVRLAFAGPTDSQVLEREVKKALDD